MKLAKPLLDYLGALPSVDDPAAFVFPQLAEMAENRVSTLSNAFAGQVLIPAVAGGLCGQSACGCRCRSPRRPRQGGGTGMSPGFGSRI